MTLSRIAAPRSVDELLAVTAEHAARTLGHECELRALLPNKRGWVAILEPSTRRWEGSRLDVGTGGPPLLTQAGDVVLDRAAAAGCASPAGVVIERRGTSSWSLETVDVRTDPELSGAGRILDDPASCGWALANEKRHAALLAYRPHRRAQIALGGDSGRIFVKVMRRRSWQRTLAKHRRLEELARASRRAGWTAFAVPRLLGSNADQRSIVCEGVAAQSLSEVLASPPALEELRRVGAALRALHAVPVESDIDASPPTLAEWQPNTEWTASFRDRLLELGDFAAAQAIVFSGRLLAALPSSGRRSLVHGDLHDKQVICGSIVTFIDTDTAAVGDPAVDVGNFLAHLRLRALQRRAPVAVEDLRAAFLDGYGDPGDGPFRRACLSVEAVSLARLSAIYALRPRWRAIAPDLARLARTVAARSGAGV